MGDWSQHLNNRYVNQKSPPASISNPPPRSENLVSKTSHHLPCYCPGLSRHLFIPELFTVATELVRPHLLWSASQAFPILLPWYFQSFVTFTKSFFLFLGQALKSSLVSLPRGHPLHSYSSQTPPVTFLSPHSPARCLCMCLLLCLECFAFHSLHPLSLPRDCPLRRQTLRVCSNLHIGGSFAGAQSRCRHPGCRLEIDPECGNRTPSPSSSAMSPHELGMAQPKPRCPRVLESVI